MLSWTPVLIILAPRTAHTLMATTFLCNFMGWTLPQELRLHLCSPCSPAITMIYWSGRSLKRFTFRFAIKSTLKKSGLLPLFPQGSYAFEGPPETLILP